MNTRALVAMMLVGAFMVAPIASADGDVPTVELPPTHVGDVPADAPALVATAAALPATIDTSFVTDLAACQFAVRVPIAVFGGNIVDTQANHLDVVATVETVLETVTRQVPIMGTVTEVVWQPSGLFGALPPVTREVMGVIGLREEVVPAEAADLDYNIVLHWQDSKIAWHQMDFEVLLALPTGLPLVGQGLGTLVTSCDGEDILPRLPSFDGMEGYEFLKVVIGGSNLGDHERWYMHILDVDVSLADAADADKPQYDQYGLLVAPSDALDAGRADLAALQDAILRGEVQVPESAVTGEPAPEVATSAAAAGSVAQGSLLAAVAGIVGSLGAAFGLRRFF